MPAAVAAAVAAVAAAVAVDAAAVAVAEVVVAAEVAAADTDGVLAVERRDSRSEDEKTGGIK